LGLNLKVERGILAPRNETEIVTQKAIALLTSSSINRHPIVYDLCCGTGNMGLAIKKYLPQARVTCVDINPLAIRNTNINAKRNNLKIKTITGDFYEAIKEKVDCIICNPPYVNEKELDKHMLHYEDKISFTNAKNDLYFYKKIISNYEKIMNNNFLIVFEIGHKQKTRLKAILKKYQLEKYSKFYKDYNQKDRILIIQYHFF
jgi:release factor glutamine methyltransferase